MFTEQDKTLAAVAAQQHGIFTLSDARAAGLTENQIEGRVAASWNRVHDGIFRAAGAPPTWRSDCYAATQAATPPAAISHSSAAALHDLPYARANILEITCRRWNRTRRAGLVVHESTRLDGIDVTIVDGVRVVTPELLVMQIAARHPFPDAVERMFQAARRKRLITYDSMHRTFSRLARRGLRGVKATRIALERWDPNSKPTQSEMETWLIQCLRAHGLPEPVTQFVVLDDFGNFVAQTDAGLPSWKITIEYQSMQEHTDEFQLAADDRRRNRILAAGYRPLHARYDDLRSGGQVLADEIRRVARRPA